MYWPNHGYRSYYDDNNTKRDIRDALIHGLFKMLTIVNTIMPFLAILNIIGITQINWWVLGGVYIGLCLIDTLGDLLEIWIKIHDRKVDYERRRQQIAEKVHKYEGLKAAASFTDEFFTTSSEDDDDEETETEV